MCVKYFLAHITNLMVPWLTGYATEIFGLKDPNSLMGRLQIENYLKYENCSSLRKGPEHE